MSVKYSASLLKAAVGAGFGLLVACRMPPPTAMPDAGAAYRIQTLFQLSDSERILQFYSPYKGTVGGNVITTQRIAWYWVSEQDTMRKDTASAYYSQIAAIDTVRRVGFMRAPYLRITRKDTSFFKVYVDGSAAQVDTFFRTALDAWRYSQTIADTASDADD